MKVLPKIFPFLLGLVFFASFANSSLALEAGALGIRPANPDPAQPFGKSWFIYSADIGKEISDKVEVVNLANVPVRARVWAADAITTPDGAYAIKEESSEMGTWINFPGFGSSITVDLGANEAKTLDFVLKVPTNAEVGDHMGAIMTQAVGTLAELEGKRAEIAPGIKIVTRIGARVYLTVPGEQIRALEFPKFDWEMRDGKFYFLLTLLNKGNVRIEPQGEIAIKNILGTKIDELKIPDRVIFPKGEIVLPVEWGDIPFWVKFGGFTAAARIVYGPGLEATQTMTAVTLPWYVPTIFGGIVVLLILLWVTRKILRQREKKLLKEYIVQKGETVVSIAENFGMSWKKLARINGLKAPYTLGEGRKIFIIERK